MEFCHISPTHFLHELNGRYRSFENHKTHLTLAHLVEESQAYSDFYNPRYEKGEFDPISFTRGQLIDFNDKPVIKPTYHSGDVNRRTDFAPLGRGFNHYTIIMDNSAFEMYQRNLPMFPGEKLVELGQKIKADYIVMPDYPGEPQWNTIEAASVYGPIFKEAGFGTFFVPQSEIGDLEGYLEAFAFAATSPLVDYIGISIIGVPNAYGVYNNPVQQYLSRKMMMGVLHKSGLLQVAKKMGKKIHFLGMLDGPNEILEVYPFMNYIDTWDSSAAVWAGINGVGFDNSPTGLINGKIKSHVDFDLPYEYDRERDDLIKSNIKYIDDLVDGINKDLKETK